MSSASKQVPGRSEVELLRNRVRQLELERSLLERSLLVADHERQKAQEMVQHLQRFHGKMPIAMQDIGCTEIDRAMEGTRKMLASIYASMPTVPEAPEDEIQ